MPNAILIAAPVVSAGLTLPVVAAAAHLDARPSASGDRGWTAAGDLPATRSDRVDSGGLAGLNGGGDGN